MIETSRLIVRAWRPADRAVYLATCNTRRVTRFLGGPQDEAAIDAGLARIAASQATEGFCFWAVERKADRAFLGYCGLKRAVIGGTPVDGEIEIGWRLAKRAWGQGFASEAARACLDWAWATLDTPRVIAITTPANIQSQAVMRRIGMVRRPDLDFPHPAFPASRDLRDHIAFDARRATDRIGTRKAAQIRPRQGEVAPKATEGEDGGVRSKDPLTSIVAQPAPSVSFAATSPWRGRITRTDTA